MKYMEGKSKSNVYRSLSLILTVAAFVVGCSNSAIQSDGSEQVNSVQSNHYESTQIEPTTDFNALNDDEKTISSKALVSRETWTSAYADAIKNIKPSGYAGFTTIYLNDDDIPEIVYLSLSGSNGCQIWSFQMNDLGGYVTHISTADGYNLSYVERGNIIVSSGNSNGDSNWYVDNVITLADGKLVHAFNGEIAMAVSDKTTDTFFVSGRGGPIVERKDYYAALEEAFSDYDKLTYDVAVKYTSVNELESSFNYYPETLECEYHALDAVIQEENGISGSRNSDDYWISSNEFDLYGYLEAWGTINGRGRVIDVTVNNGYHNIMILCAKDGDVGATMSISLSQIRDDGSISKTISDFSLFLPKDEKVAIFQNTEAYYIYRSAITYLDTVLPKLNRLYDFGYGGECILSGTSIENWEHTCSEPTHSGY